MSIEAMKQALEALKSMKETLAEHDEPTTFNEDEAIKALEEALAKQEQGEPVAWALGDHITCDYVFLKETPLYTTPQQRKPLTDEQIATISVECATVSPSDIYFARAIEAAHGIKE